jgi:Tol biopolymer transport system component
MALPAGTRLGPYEILASIGAGGMGEVYRARDSRLGRTVAVKLLAPHLAASPEVRLRFEREARTVSQLSHPNICAVYDVGRQGDLDYLVMEHLEGETLAARLAGGPMPLDDLLRCAAEIADALARAHAAGVVHRDLKPGNVMLTSTGTKLLDFGLARIVEPESSPGRSAAETAARSLTDQGAVLGTLAYMAPEQLEGKPADARADVFAFGAVVYEMATGRAAFEGTSRAALMVSVLSSDPPPLSRVAPLTPPSLERIVRVCLSKTPAARWQSMHDVALQLRNIPKTEAAVASSSIQARPSAGRRILPWLTSALLAAGLAAAFLLRPRPPAGPSPVRLALPPPPGKAFSATIEARSYAFSPDGQRLAFVAAGSGAPRQIWIRPLASFEARPLAGTEGGASPFWSPDGRSIAFFAAGKLSLLDVARGTVLALCDVPAGIGYAGTWGAEGVILFASVQGDAIYRISRAGEKPEILVRSDLAAGNSRVSWPWFLPDGRRFLYDARHPDGSATLMLGRPGKPSKPLATINSDAQYVDPGFVVFVRDGTLLAQKFDLSTEALVGEPAPVADPVVYFQATAGALFGTSRTGAVVYQSARDTMRLMKFDRSGAALPKLEPAAYLNVAISGDGRRALFDRQEPRTGTFNLWMLDAERGTEVRLTSAPDTRCCPVWLPDGKSFFYSGVHGASPQIFRRDLATGREESFLPPGGFQAALDVSRDGSLLLWAERIRGGFQLRTLALTGPSRTVTALTNTSFNHQGGSLSPSGKYVVFASNESGGFEGYVAPIAAIGEKTRLSSGGAFKPFWSRDGREIFYISGDNQLMSVPVSTEPELSIGKPEALFKIPRRWTSFEAAPDGRSFFAVVEEQSADELPLHVVLNWPGELPR